MRIIFERKKNPRRMKLKMIPNKINNKKIRIKFKRLKKS